jgi:hypothetical protein
MGVSGERPRDVSLAKCSREVTSDEIAGDTPAATGNAQLRKYSRAGVEVSMHPKRLMMNVDWFAHLPIRARKLAKFF